jgi:hypothetical protein
VTTKERINRYLPAGFKLYQKARAWYLDTPAGVVDYSDGLSITPGDDGGPFKLEYISGR